LEYDVRYSFGPKIFLALTLALTCSLKFIVRDTANENAHLTVQDSVMAFLARHQFQSKLDGGRIYAVSRDCRLVIRQMVSLGYDLDGVKTMGAREGRLSFIFKGLVYSDLPLGSTVLSHYWTRLQQKIGLDASLNPVLAVAASDSCSLDALPWKEIAEL
jgi:hypothetical protein